jgi:hypothetical protein
MKFQILKKGDRYCLRKKWGIIWLYYGYLGWWITPEWSFQSYVEAKFNEFTDLYVKEKEFRKAKRTVYKEKV